MYTLSQLSEKYHRHISIIDRTVKRFGIQKHKGKLNGKRAVFISEDDIFRLSEFFSNTKQPRTKKKFSEGVRQQFTALDLNTWNMGG